MKSRFFLMLLIVLICCDSARLYEYDHEFLEQKWMVKDIPEFKFAIADLSLSYNVYCRVRNSRDYPFARIFIQYSLINQKGASLETKLASDYLFDQKTGMPLGSTGIGDLYDHQFLLLNKFKFKETGLYTIRFEQFMRTDTLLGIEAVGVRVEKNK